MERERSTRELTDDESRIASALDKGSDSLRKPWSSLMHCRGGTSVEEKVEMTLAHGARSARVSPEVRPRVVERVEGLERLEGSHRIN